MMSATNLIVFRDTREEISGCALATRLRQALASIAVDRESLISSLIVAGQIECVLADCDSTLAPETATLTNFLAKSLLGVDSAQNGELSALVEKLQVALPRQIHLSEPEGFSYYALHPADFADAVTPIRDCASVAVIGIRSIGTTLSAVTCAALAQRSISATRITVRPTGHPYNRKTCFTDDHVSWVHGQNRKQSLFLIVDEGPGLSGSSFLSVGEALELQGIPTSRIQFIGTHTVDPENLCAPGAAQRWKRYGWQSVDSRIGRSYANHIPAAGGSWRNLFLRRGTDWPPCWPEMESTKFLSPDWRHLSKFEGLGQHGQRARERGSALCEAGFSPRSTNAGDGVTRYDFESGIPFSTCDLSEEILRRIASYCAYRAAAFAATPRPQALEEMVRFNLSQELGVQLEIGGGFYDCETPVVVDARMQPQKWIRSSNGTILKVDVSADGEGHFLPGPTDIAWDLAGAIVEWDMNRDAEEFLVSQFTKHGGRTPHRALPYFVLAYSLFRASFCRMALNSTHDAAEKPRLQRALLFYQRKVKETLQRIACLHPGVQLRR